MKLNAEDLQQIAYGEYIMEHCSGDRVIGNGDELIKAKEELYLWDDFLSSLEPPPLKAGYIPAPDNNPECPVRHLVEDEEYVEVQPIHFIVNNAVYKTSGIGTLGCFLQSALPECYRDYNIFRLLPNDQMELIKSDTFLLLEEIKNSKFVSIPPASMY